MKELIITSGLIIVLYAIMLYSLYRTESRSMSNSIRITQKYLLRQKVIDANGHYKGKNKKGA